MGPFARTVPAVAAAAIAALAASAGGAAHASAARRIETIPLGAAPVSLGIAYGSLWAVAETRRAGAVVLRIRPGTGARERVAAIGPSGPGLGAIVSGGGYVWAAAGRRLARIDPSAGRVERAALTGTADAAPFGYGSVWLSTIGPRRNLLVRFNPRTLAATARIDVGRNAATGLAAGLGFVWAATPSGLLRVDPRTDRATEVSFAGPVATSLAFAAGRLWALGGGEATALDARGRIRERLDLPVAGGVSAIADDRLWATDNCGCRRGTVVEVDVRRRRRLARFPTGTTPVALAAAGREAWVANYAGSSLTRVDG